jgi:hypothetical protein
VRRQAGLHDVRRKGDVCRQRLGRHQQAQALLLRLHGACVGARAGRLPLRCVFVCACVCARARSGASSTAAAHTRRTTDAKTNKLHARTRPKTFLVPYIFSPHTRPLLQKKGCAPGYGRYKKQAAAPGRRLAQQDEEVSAAHSKNSWSARCLPCPANTVSPGGDAKAVCAACPAGTQPNAARSACGEMLCCCCCWCCR